MGLQVIGRALAFATLVAARQRLQALEHARHRLRVVTAAGEGADAETVGLGLARARVVDLALRHQPLRGGQCGHRAVVGGVAARLRRDRDRAEHRQQDRDAVLLRTLDATQHVRLGDVRDFVRHHRGDLVLALGRQHQAGIGADVAADRGERVDLPVLQHEEGEILTRLVAGCAEAVAERAQPAVDQRDLRACSRSGAAGASSISPYSFCWAGPSTSPADEPMSGRRFSCAGARKLARRRVAAVADRRGRMQALLGDGWRQDDRGGPIRRERAVNAPSARAVPNV